MDSLVWETTYNLKDAIKNKSKNLIKNKDSKEEQISDSIYLLYCVPPPSLNELLSNSNLKELNKNILNKKFKIPSYSFLTTHTNTSNNNLPVKEETQKIKLNTEIIKKHEKEENLQITKSISQNNKIEIETNKEKENKIKTKNIYIKSEELSENENNFKNLIIKNEDNNLKNNKELILKNENKKDFLKSYNEKISENEKNDIEKKKISDLQQNHINSNNKNIKIEQQKFENSINSKVDVYVEINNNNNISSNISNHNNITEINNSPSYNGNIISEISFSNVFSSTPIHNPKKSFDLINTAELNNIQSTYPNNEKSMNTISELKESTTNTSTTLTIPSSEKYTTESNSSLKNFINEINIGKENGNGKDNIMLNNSFDSLLEQIQIPIYNSKTDTNVNDYLKTDNENNSETETENENEMEMENEIENENKNKNVNIIVNKMEDVNKNIKKNKSEMENIGIKKIEKNVNKNKIEINKEIENKDKKENLKKEIKMEVEDNNLKKINEEIEKEYQNKIFNKDLMDLDINSRMSNNISQNLKENKIENYYKSTKVKKNLDNSVSKCLSEHRVIIANKNSSEGNLQNNNNNYNITLNNNIKKKNYSQSNDQDTKEKLTKPIKRARNIINKSNKFINKEYKNPLLKSKRNKKSNNSNVCKPILKNSSSSSVKDNILSFTSNQGNKIINDINKEQNSSSTDTSTLSPTLILSSSLSTNQNSLSSSDFGTNKKLNIEQPNQITINNNENDSSTELKHIKSNKNDSSIEYDINNNIIQKDIKNEMDIDEENLSNVQSDDGITNKKIDTLSDKSIEDDINKRKDNKFLNDNKKKQKLLTSYQKDSNLSIKQSTMNNNTDKFSHIEKQNNEITIPITQTRFNIKRVKKENEIENKNDYESENLNLNENENKNENEIEYENECEDEDEDENVKKIKIEIDKNETVNKVIINYNDIEKYIFKELLIKKKKMDRKIYQYWKDKEHFLVGSLVWALWKLDNIYYVGKIAKYLKRSKSYEIKFLDGYKAMVKEKHIRLFNLEINNFANIFQDNGNKIETVQITKKIDKKFYEVLPINNIISEEKTKNRKKKIKKELKIEAKDLILTESLLKKIDEAQQLNIEINVKDNINNEIKTHNKEKDELNEKNNILIENLNKSVIGIIN